MSYSFHKESWLRSQLNRTVNEIPDPSFMLIVEPYDEIILNRQFLRILGYSHLGNKKHPPDTSKIISSSQIVRLKKAKEQKLPRSGVRLRKLSLIRNDGTKIICLIKVKEFLGTQRENKTVFVCELVKIIDWSELVKDNALKDLLIEWDILDNTQLVLDFEGNIIRIINKAKRFDLRSNLKWGRNNIFDIIKKTDVEKLQIRLTQFKTGMKLPSCEYRLDLHPDKTLYIRSDSRVSYHNKINVIVTRINDISDYKETQNEILKRIIEAEEQERVRFSNDLHDELGPCLSALKMSLQSLQNQVDNIRGTEIIHNMGLMLNEAIANVKALTRNLAPGNISDHGISDTIKDLVYRLNRTAGVQINFESSGNEEAYNIQFATAVYRIVLEIINNGIRHSSANEINLKLYFDEKNVNVHYDDDGKGFDLETTLKSSKGIGLRSIINRIDHYQGSYDFSQREPNGTVITICLPFNYSLH